MSEATHLCLDCERALRDGFVELRTDGTCAKCGSKAVLDLGTLTRSVSAPAKPKRDGGIEESPRALAPVSSRPSTATDVEDVVRETDSTRAAALAQQRREREARYLQARNEFASPVRAFLIRNKLDKLNAWWDGWASCVYTSIYARAENGSNDIVPNDGDAEFVELRLSNLRGGTQSVKFYFDPEDEAWKVLGELAPHKPSRSAT